MAIDPVQLARIQFGLTACIHIIFPTLLIGLAAYIVVMEGLWIKTQRTIYREQWLFWLKPFAAIFAIAVITGAVLSFQLNTLFGGLYERTAAVLVPIRRIEFANAVFVLAGFFGIMVWGWRRFAPRVHFLASLVVMVGILISVVCVLARNSWLHTPAGYMLVEGQIQLTSLWQALFNPSFPYRFAHMMGAALASAAFVIIGVCCGYLLRARHQAFARLGLRAALAAAAVVVPLQIVSGDLHGLNTRDHQPAKLAAMEGLWDTTDGAPMVLFAWPDSKSESNRYTVEIPRLASLIITHDLNGRIAGMKSVPKDERPYMPVVFFSFRVMVAMGLLMLAVTGAGLILLYQKRLDDSRWFLRLGRMTAPAGLIATIAGWCVTETGRQPWLIHGLVRTADAVNPLHAAQAVPFIAIVISVYAVLLVACGWYLLRVLRRGPAGTQGTEGPPAAHNGLTAIPGALLP
jgi:cytochrome d ubiquinol oxidase subunit I